MANPVPRPHERIWPRRLPRELISPNTSLWFNLSVTAQRYPDKPCTVFFGQPMTYGELLAQADHLAGWLQGVGVKAGDRVLLFMQNCPQFLVSFYGILRANAVVVPVNPMNKADEFGHYVTDPEARVAICGGDLAAIVETANANLPADKRLSHVLVTRYSDGMPAQLDPHEAPAPAVEAWLRTDPALPTA